MRNSVIWNARTDENTQATDGRRRVATFTLIAILACMLAVKSFGSPTETPQPSPNIPTDNVSAVRIVDPTFCQNQTWPYIDQRCLKRADPPIATPTNKEIAAAPPLPEASGSTSPVKSSPSFKAERTSSADSPPPISPPQADDAKMSEGAPGPQSSPSGEMNAVSDNQLQPEPPPHRSERHYRHHARFLFGFRF